MKAAKCIVERTVQDVSTLITLDDGSEFIICGEIANGNVLAKSIKPVFYQDRAFYELEDSIAKEMISLAYEAFRNIDND